MITVAGVIVTLPAPDVENVMTTGLAAGAPIVTGYARVCPAATLRALGIVIACVLLVIVTGTVAALKPAMGALLSVTGPALIAFTVNTPVDCPLGMVTLPFTSALPAGLLEKLTVIPLGNVP